MLKYKVNTRILPPVRLQLLAQNGNGNTQKNAQEEDTTDSREFPEHPPETGNISVDVEGAAVNDRVTHYPIWNIPLARESYKAAKQRKTFKMKEADNQIEGSLQVKVLLDFGCFFQWLERIIWATVAVGIIWALSIDFSKATSEYCETSAGEEHTPFNILPSLSRTMSSFRVGTFLWTLSMAAAAAARLMSNYFLHKLYDTWYASNWFNNAFLFVAYHLDNLEIIVLLMIPAYSLDCDSDAHSVFFISFLGLTYTAELCQYFTRFLRRDTNVTLSDDVPNYYKHIGILILLQTLFIIVMFTGYLLHTYLCGDFYYSLFTLGEYMTVIINIRFKRDTVLFVK